MFLFYFTPALIVFILTGFLLNKLLKKQAFMDTPNERSSHINPTPKGGGIAIVLVFLSSLLLLSVTDTINTDILIPYALGGSILALIGVLDDIYNLKVFIRLLVQFVLATFAVYYLYDGPILSIQASAAILGIVWLTNLYNFMDGIDGIAAIQTITVCVPMAIILNVFGLPSVSLISLILAGSATGFLFWNFPSPAKIFMGDVGSSFIGYTIGILILHSYSLNTKVASLWIIMLMVFLWDASLTLVYRVFNKEKFWQAHNKHVYQIASRKFGHNRVTVFVFLFNLTILFPVAYLVTYDIIKWPSALLISSLPMLMVNLLFNRTSSQTRGIAK